MTAALVLVSLVLVGAVVAIIVLARQPQALVSRCAELVAQIKADNEQQVKDRDALRASQLQAANAIARLTFESARADDAVSQLAKTQAQRNAAVELVARERKQRIEGMSTDELVATINAEVTALSEAPGTALEKP